MIFQVIVLSGIILIIIVIDHCMFTSGLSVCLKDYEHAKSFELSMQCSETCTGVFVYNCDYADCFMYVLTDTFKHPMQR